MKIGFIGLGNVGAKLAGSLLRHNFDVTVRDVEKSVAQPLIDKGANWADSGKLLAETCDVVITCLPSPAVSAVVMEEAKGAIPMDTPVSGGCHRAATGNIAIFAGGDRAGFDKALPLLKVMGRQIIHTGPLGSASVLKVITNYLAGVQLISTGEAFMVAKKSGIDLGTAYEAIKISSGNSFVHETEGQLILNGSYNINFTMDHEVKDLSLFDELGQKLEVPLELSPLCVDIMKDGLKRFGPRAWSSTVVKRLEDECSEDLRAPGFPEYLVDEEPEEPGYEVRREK